MVPREILERLAIVERRERAAALAWGASRWLALAAGAMLAACLVDWLIDLRWETPGGLRGFLLFAQAALWVGAGVALVARPLLARRTERELALWVEERFREFDHRLITAVELNREGADTRGMSSELLGAVTRQAEDMTARTDFASKVDWSGLRKGLGIVAGTAAVAVLLAATSPHTSAALLARVFLSDREIPRSVWIAAEKESVIHPSGEEIRIRFKAGGRVPVEGLAGEVRIAPVDRPAESRPLAFDSRDAAGQALFSAVVPAGTSDFAARAWLRDGRTRRPLQVRYEPRPVVQKIDAWVLLPRYVGLRPDGNPFEQYRVRGEIAGPSGSSARVAIEVQKPIVKGALELLARKTAEASDAPSRSPEEEVARRIELAIGKDGRSAQAEFDLRPGEIGYRILVEDRNGFANSAPPKRGVAIVPDEPPRVVLLPERFGLPGEAALADDAEVEGMPIPLGSAVRIGYYAAHPYGIDRARLVYRVIQAAKIADQGAAAAAAEEPWQFLPLGEVHPTEKTGAFDLRRGVFENTGFRDQVEFYPMASPDPARIHGRTEGGGCFDFQTRPLKEVQVGDQIEFAVEVFARNPALSEQPGRSETRLKTFVTQPQFVDWVLETLRHESRIRQLEGRQRAVFTPEGTDR
jgi:hypothetical protein